eukprot:351612-Chlamydomonas_euryale.AAC.31
MTAAGCGSGGGGADVLPRFAGLSPWVAEGTFVTDTVECSSRRASALLSSCSGTGVGKLGIKGVWAEAAAAARVWAGLESEGCGPGQLQRHRCGQAWDQGCAS